MEEPVNEEIVEVPTTETFDLAPIEARMEEHTLEIREIRNEIGNYFAGAPSVTPPMTLHRAFATILRMVADDPGQNRALADVIGTSPGNASGLIRDAWNTELIGYVNALRPLFSAAGTAQFPSAGYGIAYPKVTTHSQVAKRTAEKAEAATTGADRLVGHLPDGMVRRCSGYQPRTDLPVGPVRFGSGRFGSDGPVRRGDGSRIRY